ncbi:sodium channel subunit beta-2 [Latimeria chalumnae]|uniref:sodium channel subunit beta-2 n=1 Tax=Latimeria chalumnae TaxID=7897 RepID=UPI0003C10D2D|nr:PREDICTED: sodium channel subunit beta-2 [Latimeria chalumnae]|eukprot:XP_005987309.1 PREDICTED: sodium channel subunit beta-2 [Latimeria chalumnae]
MRIKAWISHLNFSLLGASLLFMLVPCVFSMEVTVTSSITALNGSNVRLTCNFNSCYKVKEQHFSLNWTYQACENCSETTFLTFQRKIMYLETQFKDRVMLSGDYKKNDVSVTLSNVQLDDEGTYHCYVQNPPDRFKGNGTISLKVVTEVTPEGDSTVAVIVGASVGGFLAVVILILVAVKCIRRKKKQELDSEEQKTEEEGKTDGEGNPEEGTK